MKIVLMGEPMGLFMANEPGELNEVKTFTSSAARAFPRLLYKAGL